MTDYSPEPLSPPTNAPVQKNSGCLKVAIILGIMMVLGFGCLVIAGIAFAKKGVSMEPDKVAADADAMVQIDEGERWTPTMSMNMGVFQNVVFVNDDEGMLMIMQGSKAMFGSEEKFEAQMGGEMTKNNGELEGTREISSERLPFAFGDQTHTLQVAKTEGKKSGTEYIEVSGTVPGKKSGKIIFIYLREKANATSMEEIKDLFDGETP